MAGSPSTYENIKTVPLVVQFSWRGTNNGAVQGDAWAKNVFVEKDDDGPFSVKRPGLANVGSTVPSGFSYLQVQGALLEYPANFTYGEPYASTTYRPIVITNDTYLDMRTGLYTMAHGAATSAIPLISSQPTGCWYATANIAPEGDPAQSGANSYFAIMQSPYAVYVGYWNWNMAHFYEQQLVAAYVAGELDLSFPQQLVPGICVLDNTWYVFDISGVIWASAIASPLSFPPLNTVVADAAIGAAVAIARLGPYVVAFGTAGLQLFYDAAIFPGAPIQAVSGGIYQTGMAPIGAFSLARTEDSLIWLASNEEGNYSVRKLTGGTVSALSVAGVERFLTSNLASASPPTNQASSVSVRGTTFRSAGHEFYMLTYMPVAVPIGSPPSASAGFTLVCDLGSGAWTAWTQQTTLPYGEGAIRTWCGVTPPGGTTYFPDFNNGTCYQLSEQAYQDNGQPINVLIQTDLYSWGNQRTKIIAATYPSLDTFNSTVYLSWTNDDYTTFTPPQAIPTLTAKKQLIRCGSTVQRAWQITHTDNTPMRFFGLEVEVIPGAL